MVRALSAVAKQSRIPEPCISIGSLDRRDISPQKYEMWEPLTRNNLMDIITQGVRISEGEPARLLAYFQVIEQEAGSNLRKILAFLIKKKLHKVLSESEVRYYRSARPLIGPYHSDAALVAPSHDRLLAELTAMLRLVVFGLVAAASQPDTDIEAVLANATPAAVRKVLAEI